MFEFGLFVALAGGLLGIGLSRTGVKKKFPALADYHLDVVAVVVLVVGLLLTAVEHYRSERALRESESKIRTLSIGVTVNVSAKWKEDKIPDLSKMLMLSGTRAATADFVLRDGKVINVEFHGVENEQLAAGASGTTEIMYYSNAIPGADIYSLRPEQIGSVRNFGFTCIFSPTHLEEDTITIHRIDVTFFVNGQRSFSIERLPELTTPYADSEGRASWWTVIDCGKITRLN